MAPPYREPGSRDPLEALKLLLAAGANPNAKAPDGSTPLHQAVDEQQVAMIRALVAAGAKLDAVNKDNLTPLLLAEQPKKPNPTAWLWIRTRIVETGLAPGGRRGPARADASWSQRSGAKASTAAAGGRQESQR